MLQIQQQVVGQLEQMRRQAEINRNEDRAMIEQQYRVHNENLKRIAIAPACVVG
jgi:predicted ATP-binding protein involved in virulence